MHFWKIICFGGRERKDKTWKGKDRMIQDCYYAIRIFIKTTIRRYKNNVDRYDKHVLTFCWILWDMSNEDIS
jgi:hypothetical protein